MSHACYAHAHAPPPPRPSASGGPAQAHGKPLPGDTGSHPRRCRGGSATLVRGHRLKPGPPLYSVHSLHRASAGRARPAGRGLCPGGRGRKGDGDPGPWAPFSFRTAGTWRSAPAASPQLGRVQGLYRIAPPTSRVGVQINLRSDGHARALGPQIVGWGGRSGSGGSLTPEVTACPLPAPPPKLVGPWSRRPALEKPCHPPM